MAIVFGDTVTVHFEHAQPLVDVKVEYIPSNGEDWRFSNKNGTLYYVRNYKYIEKLRYEN